MRLEQRREAVQAGRVGHGGTGLEAPAGGLAVAELERGETEQGKRIAVALRGMRLQLRVVGDLVGVAQRMLLDVAWVTVESPQTSD